MANKTQPLPDSVDDFLAGVSDPRRRADSQEMSAFLQRVTGVRPTMWGSAIVGFGTYHYKYATGREGDTVAVGFSPRKAALVVYGVLDYDQNLDRLPQLGPHTAGKGCIYIKDFSKIDRRTFEEMVRVAFERRRTDG